MSAEKSTQLLEGERILWKGHPKREAFSIVDYVSIIFLLVFGLAGYMVVSKVLTMFEVPTQGIEFIGNHYLIGFIIFYVGFIFINQIIRYEKKKHTYYFITNLRAIIVKRYRQEIFTSVKIYPGLEVNLKSDAKGNGTILFGSSSFLNLIFSATASANVHIDSDSEFYSTSPFSAGFYFIDDAKEVYQLVRKTMGDER